MHALYVQLFFFNESATADSYTYGHSLALHAARPISLARCGDANRRRLADYRLAMCRLALLAGLAARHARFAFFATDDLDDQVAVLEALRLVLPESIGLAAAIDAQAALFAGQRVEAAADRKSVV